MRKPKNTPMPTPAATLRRLSCHSQGRCSRGPSQRRLLCERSFSGVGSRRPKRLRGIYFTDRQDRAKFIAAK